MAFTTNAVVRLLTLEGLIASPARLRYAIQRGHIPQPPVCAMGNLQWSDTEIEAARRYCKRPIKAGRPRFTVQEGQS